MRDRNPSMASNQTGLGVLMMPDYRADNPYQQLLSTALEREGAVVQFPKGYRRVFPLFRAIKDEPKETRVLHLHWIDQYIKGENWFVKLVYGLKFLLDILIVRSSSYAVVWTIHNTVSHNAKFPRLELWIQRRLIQLVDGVIVHSQAALAEVANTYRTDLSKAAVIPHGHYRDVYPPAVSVKAARDRLNLPQDKQIFLTFGMLRPYKGIENLLQVWQSQQAPDRILLISGKAHSAEYETRLVHQASEVANVMLQTHFIPESQLPLYFSAADAVLLPFEKILTSGSLILAMSYGKSVIAPRLDNLAETLAGADDLLYDFENSQGLSNAIKSATTDRLAAVEPQIVAACDRLNWQPIAEKTFKLYTSTVDHVV